VQYILLAGATLFCKFWIALNAKLARFSGKNTKYFMNNYYVYQLVDPRTSTPFYIGEGKGKRAWSHLDFTSRCNNDHKDRIIRKIQSMGLQVIVEILYSNISKEESEKLEEQIIQQIGLKNLSNITPNAHPPILRGEKNGFYGKTHTKANRKKCGDSNRGKNIKTEKGAAAIAAALVERWKDPIQRENQIEKLKARKGEKRSEAAKEAYRKSASERDANMTPEQRSARTMAGVATKKIKYAGLRRQSYIDEMGKKRFRYVASTD
jgi:hypothetical protein